MKELINKPTWTTIVTVSTIVCGVFYLEDRISKIIYDAVNPINVRVEVLELSVKQLKETQILTEYKLNVFEKYFVKPSEIKLENGK